MSQGGIEFAPQFKCRTQIIYLQLTALLLTLVFCQDASLVPGSAFPQQPPWGLAVNRRVDVDEPGASELRH